MHLRVYLRYELFSKNRPTVYPASAAILGFIGHKPPASATGKPHSLQPRPGQQVVLVTGSTAGLGREVALRMGSRGAHAIGHGRNRQRGVEVVSEIEATAAGSARFYQADFASFSWVREFAQAVLRDYGRLDILVNNAGFGSAPDERLLSEDGHEFRFQVNHLSHFLRFECRRDSRLTPSCPSPRPRRRQLAPSPSVASRHIQLSSTVLLLLSGAGQNQDIRTHTRW